MSGEGEAPAPGALPRLPLEPWEDTKRTLHLFLQVVGKVRLALHPPLNHWWHAPLYTTARGFGTGWLPHPSGGLQIDFDTTGSTLRVRTAAGAVRELPLEDGLSVAAFHEWLMNTLAEVSGEAPPILARPFDPERVGSDTPFARDRTHASWDADAVRRFHRVLAWSHGVFQAFAGRYVGKASPSHFFWHSMDLAYTRFSGRRAPVADDADPVTREAYSHEVVSFGFWPGDAQVRSRQPPPGPPPPHKRNRPTRPPLGERAGRPSFMH
ncbi:MAG: hypothetical protein EA352_06750 [Gemmatimonadales bacterium]|nr:MAG: hypothetical protein EA352_06750 [Gemmatimonadales bacterium]